MRIVKLTINDSEIVFEWVLRLLSELGEEGDELGSLNRNKLMREWRAGSDCIHIFAARNEADDIAGILTLVETFAIYANGNYGIIQEMYVSPEHRSAGVGAMLIDAVRQFGKQRNWARIDVTAPESNRWERTRRFYEKQGFVFTGPKLKLLL